MYIDIHFYIPDRSPQRKSRAKQARFQRRSPEAHLCWQGAERLSDSRRSRHQRDGLRRMYDIWSC